MNTDLKKFYQINYTTKNMIESIKFHEINILFYSI
jgi:hypothetical protein